MATTYADLHLNPSLRPALAALCRVRPADPVTWLAEYLLAHKPSPPVERAAADLHEIMGCGDSKQESAEPSTVTRGVPPAKQHQQTPEERVRPMVKIPDTLVLPTDHKAVPLLMKLDDKLAAALASGAIKLVRADFMTQSAEPHLLRRQDLEALEREQRITVFLTPDEAVDALRSNRRAIAALTYGWVTPDHPDVVDAYLANIRRFLAHPLGKHIVGLFWDFASLPQKPRSEEEAAGFKVALGCMGDVYASAFGTTVVRHRTIPQRPASLDGELVVLVEGDEVVTAEQEAALTAELAKHGAVESVRREPGRLRVRLASHAAAEAAAAAGVAGAMAVFPFFNDRAYEVRDGQAHTHSPHTFQLTSRTSPALLGARLDVLRERREHRGDRARAVLQGSEGFARAAAAKADRD